jgi:two-component system sensor histidine kinase YesM
VNQAAKLGNAFYTSYYIDGFLTHEYESNLDYYNSYKQFFDDTLVHLVTGQNALNFCIYLKNDTITNGAEFQQLSKAKGTKWYEYVVTSQLENGLFFDNIVNTDGKIQRKIYFFQRLNYFDYSSPNILLITLDYTKCCEYMENLNFEDKAYICDDSRVLISNGTYSNVGKYYGDVNDLKNIRYTQDFLVYGQELTIKINDESSTFWEIMRKKWYQLLFMVIINIALPLFVSSLMHMNFKNKLKEQEMVVARKNAELLALHSQINPHFLFNALESIRMHSLLKQETETARMVEHLAKLQRQYTEWKQDTIKIEYELEFVEAYLQLQKYRFGDRLSFEIDVDEECKDLMIPKLTIVTFVENACVHGIESKTTPGWIFVRLSIKDERLFLEIEDTGNGMPEVGVKLLLEKMRDANIDMLKDKGRVGIINACLRLKMLSDNQVGFDLESEIGTGTLVQISIPTKFLKGKI